MIRIQNYFSAFIFSLLLSGCFQKEDGTQSANEELRLQEVTQTISDEPSKAQKEYPEMNTQIPEPEYPPLPIPQNLVEKVKNETVDLIDAQGRAIEVKLIDLKRDIDIYITRFIRLSDNQEYSLDLRKLSANSQQIVHAFFKYRDYLAEKERILAEWENKVAHSQNSEGMSETANQIFNSLSNMSN